MSESRPLEPGLFVKVGCSLCRSPDGCTNHSEVENDLNADGKCEESESESEFMIAALALERLCLIIFCGATAALASAFFIYGYTLQEIVPEKINQIE